MKSIPLDKGRISQKAKTRTKILNAAKSLMSEDKKITLEEVALKAGVGRATIYRYFPNIDLLYTEASLDIHFSSPEELFEEVKDMPLEQRLLHIQDYYNTMAQDHELIFRRYLSATLLESLGSDKKIRGARRVEAMSLALAESNKTLSKENLERLKNVGTILMGIESLIVAKDVCGLSDKQTKETLNWALEMILKGLDHKKPE